MLVVLKTSETNQRFDFDYLTVDLPTVIYDSTFMLLFAELFNVMVTGKSKDD